MPFRTVPIDGGLDLQSPPVAVAPGRLYDGRNFEVAHASGVRRVDGYERFDGGPSPSTLSAVAFEVNGATDVLLGRQVTVDHAVEAALVVGVQPMGGGMGRVYVRANGPVGELRDSFMQVLNEDGTLAGKLPIYGGIQFPLEEGRVTEAEWLEMTDRAYMLVRESVRPVPGVGPVCGLFWLRDHLLAVRDLLTVEMDGPIPDTTSLYMGDPVSGVGGFSATVFEIRRHDDETTTLVLHSPSRVFTGGELKASRDRVIGTFRVVDPAGAGLYKATGERPESWSFCDLGRSLPYKEAQVIFPPMSRSEPTYNAGLSSTEWRSPKTFRQSKTWWRPITPGTPLEQLFDGSDTDDTKGLECSNLQINFPGSALVSLTNFGFTEADIPDGAIITGIEVEVRRYAKTPVDLSAWVKDREVFVRKADNARGDNIARGEVWSGSGTGQSGFSVYVTQQYGGDRNLLGLTGLKADDVRKAEFGLHLSAEFQPPKAVPQPAPIVQARINMVRMRVHYIPPQPIYYVWNPDEHRGYRIRIVTDAPDKLFAEAPDEESDDILGEGRLYLAGEFGAVPIIEGCEIRTAPQPGATLDGGVTDGSTLVAVVAGELRPNMLDPSREAVRYQGVTTNFYATTDFDAIYGVSGAGPAFMYDGSVFARIHTGLEKALEIPRHLVPYRGRLYLGYPAGSVQFSAAGDPLNFSGVDGAGELGVASPVTGMVQLNGQALAVFTRDNVQMIQGDADNLAFLAPHTGAIEYTAASAGANLYVSNRGIEGMDTTPAYGDFATQTLSAAVSSWLTERVQRTAAWEGRDKSVTAALPVRAKRQYRVFFADGRALTATFLRPGEMPQFTIQEYPQAWTSLLAATETRGRDRLFAGGADGYVYELDRGNRFDDEPINAWVALAVDDQDEAALKKRFTDGIVHGSAAGAVTFTLSHAVDYDKATASTRIRQDFGRADDVATGETRFYASKTELRAYGRAITFRFDVSGVQPPVTLQAITYNVIPTGEDRT